MLGFSFEKVLLLLVLLAVLVGPERLPAWAATLRQQARIFARAWRDAKGRVGAELDETMPDWREYDPRKLRRPNLAALLADDDDAPAASKTPAPSAQAPTPVHDKEK